MKSTRCFTILMKNGCYSGQCTELPKSSFKPLHTVNLKNSHYYTDVCIYIYFLGEQVQSHTEECEAMSNYR